MTTFDLDRFVAAQAPVHESAFAELRAGRKGSHWMWFIFPQLHGLGVSPTAAFYGIASLDEARAYLAHDLLGPRLLACTRTTTEAKAPSLRRLFGSPDDLKFRSSMTLFEAASTERRPFAAALDRWCGGVRDAVTLDLLAMPR